jgi:ABC-type multidrug transport system fused ATPase/permease subunit
LCSKVTISATTLRSLAAQIGMVTQETHLFTYDPPTALRPAGCNAGGISGLPRSQHYDFITGLPHGYDTIVSERGYRLSGGENSARHRPRHPERPRAGAGQATSTSTANQRR